MDYFKSHYWICFISLLLYVSVGFFLATRHAGSLLLSQGLNPHVLHWKAVLTLWTAREVLQSFNIGICLLRSYSLRPRALLAQIYGPEIVLRKKNFFIYWDIGKIWLIHDCTLVGCYFSCVQLSGDSMDCSPPASPVCGILLCKNTRVGCNALLQDRPDPEIKPSSLTPPALAGGFYHWATRKPSFWLSILNTAVVSWPLHAISSFPCCPFSVSSSNYWDWPPVWPSSFPVVSFCLRSLCLSVVVTVVVLLSCWLTSWSISLSLSPSSFTDFSIS